MIARDGWRLLPLYTYETETGVWRHREGLPKPPASLKNVRFDSPAEVPTTQPIEVLEEYLDEAKGIFSEAPLDDGSGPELTGEAEELRWFPTPMEVGK